MESWNDKLFLAFNSPAVPNPAVLMFARIAAEDIVYLAALLAVCLWIWGAPGKRSALIATGTALLVSFAISSGIGFFWYHPRPFVIGLGHTFLVHAPDSSFPSDHTTFLWTFAFSLLATQTWPSWGWVLAAAGLLTAWARVYVGIHYPFDMIGSFFVAGLGAVVAWAVYLHLANQVLPVLEYPYEAFLRAVHLPTSVFPRRQADR